MLISALFFAIVIYDNRHVLLC